jgi:hypothetical protein
MAAPGHSRFYELAASRRSKEPPRVSTPFGSRLAPSSRRGAWTRHHALSAVGNLMPVSITDSAGDRFPSSDDPRFIVSHRPPFGQFAIIGGNPRGRDLCKDGSSGS